MNNFICQNNTLQKAGETVSKSKIVLKHKANNTGRKTWLTDRSGEIYRNWETLGDTRTVDRSGQFSFFSGNAKLHQWNELLQKTRFVNP